MSAVSMMAFCKLTTATLSWPKADGDRTAAQNATSNGVRKRDNILETGLPKYCTPSRRAVPSGLFREAACLGVNFQVNRPQRRRGRDLLGGSEVHPRLCGLASFAIPQPLAATSIQARLVGIRNLCSRSRRCHAVEWSAPPRQSLLRFPNTRRTRVMRALPELHQG